MENKLNNINKLVIDKEYSYKELCEILEWKYATGNTKRAQINLLKDHYEIKKEKTKYLIVRKRAQEEIDVSHQTKGLHIPKDERFGIPIEHKHDAGIYLVCNEVEKLAYIGQTKDFYLRFLSHRYQNLISIMNKPDTKMTMLCICQDKNQRNILEAEYIYRFLERTKNSDWTLINQRLADSTESRKIYFCVSVEESSIVEQMLKEKGVSYERKNRI